MSFNLYGWQMAAYVILSIMPHYISHVNDNFFSLQMLIVPTVLSAVFIREVLRVLLPSFELKVHIAF